MIVENEKTIGLGKFLALPHVVANKRALAWLVCNRCPLKKQALCDPEIISGNISESKEYPNDTLSFVAVAGELAGTTDCMLTIAKLPANQGLALILLFLMIPHLPFKAENRPTT